MAEEAGKAAKDAVKEIIKLSASDGSFSFNISTDNAQVVRDVCITAVTLGTIYAGYKLISKKIDAAVKKSLGGDRPDQDPPEVTPGSLHVFLHCKTDERFLEVLAEFESGRMKKCFEKEFHEIGIEVQGLKIEIENLEEVKRTKLGIEERMYSTLSEGFKNIPMDSKTTTEELQDVEEGRMSPPLWENEEKRNFISMHSIVNAVVSDGLRRIFKQEWNRRYQAKFGAWDDTSVSGQQLHNFEQTRKRPNRIMCQSNFIHGDTSQWDCRVLFDAILYSKSIGSASLNPTVRSEVDSLRFIRNKVRNNEEGKLSDNEFQAMMTDVENAFKGLGLSTSRITRIIAKRNLYRSFQILPSKPAHDVILRPKKIREISEDLQRLRSGGKLTYFYICGNPGSGKSQLARQVCENIWNGVNLFEETIFVMTLNGKDLDSLLNSYEDFARHLNCDESVLVNILISTGIKEQKIKDLRSLITTRIKNWRKWWLVVDNVENLEIISSLLPLTGDAVWNHGQIILTTQNRNHVPSDSLLTKHVTISSGMSDLESRHLLSSLSQSDGNDPLLDTVAERLDRQPLAMAGAAVYFKRAVESASEFSWHDYLQKLEDGKRQITEKQLRNISPVYPSTMTAAILLAVEKCIENDSNLKHTFQFFSFVSFESMPLDLVAKYIQLVDENFDQDELFLAIQHCSLFLPAENENRDIQMHRVVHEVIQFVCEGNTKAEMAHVSQASGAERQPNDVKCYFQNVAQTLYHFKDRLDKAKLIPHLKAFNEVVKKLSHAHEQLCKEGSFTERYEVFQTYIFFADILRKCYQLKLSVDFLYSSLQLSQGLQDELCVADNYERLGNVYEDMCEWKKAVDFHQRALEIRKRQLGEKHVDVAASYRNLGQAYRHIGELVKAKEYFEQALEIFKEQLGEKHVEVASAYDNLGLVYKTTGDYEKAKSYHQRALEIREHNLGENHVDVAASYNNLGEVFTDTGELAKANEYFERALEIRRRLLGETHVDVARCYNNLAMVYEITGEYEKAKKYLQRAVEITKELLGENHLDIARSYNSLGLVYQITGEYEKAKDYLQRAVEITKELLGENHLDIARSYTNLGLVYEITGEYEKAKDYLQRAVEITKELLGENHLDIARSYNNLGLVYEITGEYDKAKDYLQRAVEITKVLFDEKHVHVASSYNNLGMVYKITGEYEKAKNYFQRAVEITKELVGEKNVDVARSYNNLGMVYEVTGEYEKAKDYLLRALEITIEQLGKNHPDVARSYNDLGIVYVNTKEYEKAYDYLLRALEIRQQQLGENHPDVAASYNNLGEVYRRIGEMGKAKDYHLRALEIRKQQLGEKHVDVASSFNNLGLVHQTLGEYEKAKDLFQRALEIRRQQLGEKHLDVTSSFNNLGLVYQVIGDNEKAQDMFYRGLEL